ncbi:MAG: hypothetical protein ABI682_06170 [Acidobacteriota bacterium]
MNVERKTPMMNPRTLRRVHLYLGALFAPVLLAFAASGAWQVYRWNDAKKDGSYKPPAIVKILSNIHRNQTLGKETPAATAAKAFMFLASLALITTTILGIVMAYRFTARPLTVTLCLLAGIVAPAVLLLLGR